MGSKRRDTYTTGIAPYKKNLNRITDTLPKIEFDAV
jgi:hypothetical protein